MSAAALDASYELVPAEQQQQDPAPADAAESSAAPQSSQRASAPAGGGPKTGKRRRRRTAPPLAPLQKARSLDSALSDDAATLLYSSPRRPRHPLALGSSFRQLAIDEHLVPAPVWFEHEIFRMLSEDTRVWLPLYVLLGALPFLSSAGSFLELFYGCPTISRSVEALFACGVFSFAVVPWCLFRGLRRVVRGAHRNEELLQQSLAGEEDDEDLESEKVERLQSSLVDAAKAIQHAFRRHMAREKYLATYNEPVPDPDISPLSFKEAARRAFDETDRDTSGEIDIHELRGLMQRLGESPTKLELEQIMAEVDADGSGSLNFEEFLGLMRNVVAHAPTTRDLKEAFHLFDKDGNGHISASELLFAVAQLGDKMASKEIMLLMKMISESDEDDDGHVSYPEFISMLGRAGAVAPPLFRVPVENGATQDVPDDSAAAMLRRMTSTAEAVHINSSHRVHVETDDDNDDADTKEEPLKPATRLRALEEVKQEKEGQTPRRTRSKRQALRAKLASLVVLGVEHMETHVLQEEIERLKFETIEDEVEQAFTRTWVLRRDFTKEAVKKSLKQHLSWRSSDIGPFSQLAFDLEPGQLMRVKVTKNNYNSILMFCAVYIVIGLFMLCLSCMGMLGVIELWWHDFDIKHSDALANETLTAFTVDELFFPNRRCVGAAADRVLGWLMLILWFPGCVVASVVWPLWMMSLQVSTALANDDVEDLMRKLRPKNVRQRFSTTNSLTSERNWQREVALPGALLVSTMSELSHWGLE